MSSFSFTPELKKELQTLQQNLGQETRNLKDSRITHLETEIKLLSQRVNNLVSMDILKQKKRAHENNMNRILLKQMMTENRKLRDDYRDLNQLVAAREHDDIERQQELDILKQLFDARDILNPIPSSVEIL